MVGEKEEGEKQSGTFTDAERISHALWGIANALRRVATVMEVQQAADDIDADPVRDMSGRVIK